MDKIQIGSLILLLVNTLLHIFGLTKDGGAQ